MNPTEGSSGQEIDVIYKTKHANILGRYVLFLLQNDAGPCALLAICKLVIGVINKRNISFQNGLGSLIFTVKKSIIHISKLISETFHSEWFRV